MVATYVIAPLPNWICGRFANPDDFLESSGSAVIDFGRFMTGFLVVMGIGTIDPSHFPIQSFPPALAGRGSSANRSPFSHSPTSIARSLWCDYVSGHGNVDHRRPFDIRHNYKLYDVFPRGAGLLILISCTNIGQGVATQELFQAKI